MPPRRRGDFGKRIADLLHESRQFGESKALDELTRPTTGGGGGRPPRPPGSSFGLFPDEPEEPGGSDPYQGPPESLWEVGDSGTGVIEGEELSDNIYSCVLQGVGKVEIRPVYDDQEVLANYGANLRGYLEGGNRKHSADYYSRRIEDFRGQTVSGILPNGRIVHNARLETNLDKIKNLARREYIVGRNVWRQVGGS